MHRSVCGLDSVRNQADGEPQRVAFAKRGARGDFVFQVVYKARSRGTCAPADAARVPCQAELFADEQGLDHQPSNQPTNQPTISWDEGCRYWWDLSNVVRLPEPIPCRGNVGMWQMPKELAEKVDAADCATMSPPADGECRRREVNRRRSGGRPRSSREGRL